MHLGAGPGSAPTAYRAVGGADAPLALAEVKPLCWFLHGSIMSPGTRHHLWKSCGFCSRHTWAHDLTLPTAGNDPFLVEQWRRANRLERTRARLAASRATWLPSPCPVCDDTGWLAQRRTRA